MPVAVNGLVREVADADRVAVPRHAHPAVSDEARVGRRDVLLAPVGAVVGRPVEVERGPGLDLVDADRICEERVDEPVFGHGYGRPRDVAGGGGEVGVVAVDLVALPARAVVGRYVRPQSPYGVAWRALAVDVVVGTRIVGAEHVEVRR